MHLYLSLICEQNRILSVYNFTFKAIILPIFMKLNPVFDTIYGWHSFGDIHIMHLNLPLYIVVYSSVFVLWRNRIDLFMIVFCLCVLFFYFKVC